MPLDQHIEDLSGTIKTLGAPELNELRRLIDLRLDTLQRAGDRSLVERLSAAQNVELAALAVRRTGIRCRTLDTGASIPEFLRPIIRARFVCCATSRPARRTQTQNTEAEAR
jgi:hypothetical protein